MTITTQEFAEQTGISYKRIRNLIARQIKRHPKLSEPLFIKSAFINANGNAEMGYQITDDGRDYLRAELGISTTTE